ncbi:MAG: hypothetical protein Q8R35_02380 [bacterium]|nr:hypothetical protein [bacterium]
MLSTPATIAFFVFLGLLGLGIFLTGSLLRTTGTIGIIDVAQAIKTRQNSLLNFTAMFGLFILVVLALWAISHDWGTTRLDRGSYVLLLVFSGLMFLVPFFTQISLWARCKAIDSAPAALRVAR